MPRSFQQVDVFTSEPLRGNPVAVVLDGEGLSDAEMQRFAQWTNLSETTFVLPPTDAGADYRVRIFTPAAELPFAGHPTLGTCHAWLRAGGAAAAQDRVVQECEIGLITIRRDGGRLAFAAPPLVRSGPVEPAERDRFAAMLGLTPADVVDAAWVDNGPGWAALLVRDAETVLAAQPSGVDGKLGLVGPHEAGAEAAFELRAFYAQGGTVFEDPVTGSLNASVAQWLLGSGRARAPYVAAQGAAIGRAGRVHVDQDADGTVWVGGGTVTVVEGTVDL
jgi:PhzF family phenazine biosynthesis protein